MGGGAVRAVSLQGSATCEQTRVSAMVFNAMIGFLLTRAGGPHVRRHPRRELWGDLRRVVWGRGSGDSDLRCTTCLNKVAPRLLKGLILCEIVEEGKATSRIARERASYSICSEILQQYLQ